MPYVNLLQKHVDGVHCLRKYAAPTRKDIWDRRSAQRPKFMVGEPLCARTVAPCMAIKGKPSHSVDLQAVVEPCKMTSGAALAAHDGYATIEDCVGNTPLVRLQRLSSNPSNIILAKLEGNNPAGSVKDRYSAADEPVCTAFLSLLFSTWGCVRNTP